MIVLAVLEPALLNSEDSPIASLYRFSQHHDSPGPHIPQMEMFLPKSLASGTVEFALSPGGCLNIPSTA